MIELDPSIFGIVSVRINPGYRVVIGDEDHDSAIYKILEDGSETDISSIIGAFDLKVDPGKAPRLFVELVGPIKIDGSHIKK